MLLRVEKGSATPISRQLADQIAALFTAGKLKAGDRLPSVRELARELAVNQNTILRVYEKLASEGVVEMRQGQGTFVAELSRAGRRRAHCDKLADEFRSLVRQALSLGLSKRELQELLSSALAELDDEAVSPLTESERV